MNNIIIAKNPYSFSYAGTPKPTLIIPRFYSPPPLSPTATNRRNNHRSSGSIGEYTRNVTSRSRIRPAVTSSSISSWDTWSPDNASPPPSLSDALWPALGAFGAMAMMGKIDQILAPRGVAMTIAPLGAVSAVLFLTPSSPAARKYNMFMAQIGCAAIGVAALTLFGPGWLARSVALAASLAFMVYTKCTHPPAASLPLLFIDGVKLHHLNFWYALFPGAVGCIIIALIQEIVCYMKANYKF